MIKKILVIIIVLLTFCSCSKVEEESFDYPVFNEYGVTFDVEEIDLELKNKYYYQQLSADEKLYYQALYNAAKNNTSTVKWNFFPDSTILKRARRAFVEDNPLYFWVNYQSFIYTEKITIESPFKDDIVYYESTPENSQSIDIEGSVKKIETIGKQVIEQCYDENPYEYVKNIHDYICENVEYVDDNENVQTIYGALIDGECVCEGYARAFQYLANVAGFECIGVTGFANFPIDENTPNTAHEWNKIKINDYWYMVDTTWDDQVTNENKNLITYAYFLLNDEYEKIDHRLSERFSLKYPVCDDPVLFHIEAPVCAFDSYDSKLIEDFIMECLNSKSPYLILRFLNKEDYMNAVMYLNDNGVITNEPDETNSIFLLTGY